MRLILGTTKLVDTIKNNTRISPIRTTNILTVFHC